MNKSTTSIGEIGNSLIEHARDASLEARHGIVSELFPYLVQASKKMSGRAIGRFLEDEHNVKISYVTIGRALRQPEKMWNYYFDLIEDHAWIVAQTHSRNLKDFMSEPEKYQEMLESEKVYLVEDKQSDSEILDAISKYGESVATLDEKWFCFDEDTLEDARIYLIKRFNKKTIRKLRGILIISMNIWIKMKDNIPDIFDNLLRKKQVAVLLACSQRTVDRLVSSGQLTRIKILGGVRFRQSEVQSIIKNYVE